MHDRTPPRHSRLVERSPVPYAWIVLAAAVVASMLTVPGQTVGVSVFLDKIIADLDVERSTVSLLYTAGTLAGAAALPLVGRFIDVRGPRLAVGLITGAFALACLFMAGVGGLVSLAIAFVLLRGLGQGSLSLVSLHVVNLWFVRRRGLAIGVTGLGMAFATAVFPAGLETLIGNVGWRGGYVALALLVGLVALPLGVTFFRGHPERYGARPDGGRAAPDEDEAAARETNLDLPAARRTGAFWFLTLGDAFTAMLSTGLVFHHYDILAQSGFDRLAAASVFLPFGIVTAIANLGTGALLDRMPPRYLLAGMLFVQGATAVLVGWLPAWLLLGYGVLLGTAQGMKGTITGSAYAYYFGRRHIGAIKGLATTLSVAGTAVGPVVLSFGKDLAGSYVPALLLAATPVLLLGVASLWLRPPRAAEAAPAAAASD